MAEHWANLDLHLDVNLDGARLGRSLEEALRGAVRDGRLPAGTRLPSSRALAADLGIARNTVGDAYAQLAAEGWLTGRAGAGTWVTGPRDVTGRPPRGGGAGAAGRSVPQAVAGQPRAPAFRYDLNAGVPDLAAFPAGSGWPPEGGHWPPHQITCWGIRTPGGWPRCARRWPGT
jgi:GntR family transcriptional regulator/MocR family aminotransferase